VDGPEDVNELAGGRCEDEEDGEASTRVASVTPNGCDEKLSEAAGTGGVDSAAVATAMLLEGVDVSDGMALATSLTSA
jgi:hypothetical protein